MKKCFSRYHGLVTAAAVFVLAGPGWGQSEQVIRFNGGSDDHAQAIATDSAGAIYVAGAVRDNALPIQFAVVKHNAQGVFQWVARYQGTAGQIDGRAAAVATDAAGNVYAAGYVARQIGFSYNVDWLVVSFNSSGGQRWAHVLNSPGDGYDAATKLAVSSSGEIYVTGLSGLGNDLNWLTIKYSPAGSILWQRSKAGVSNADDRPVALNLGADGNLVVLGYTSNLGLGLAKDLSIVKYDPSGGILWSRDFSDTTVSDELPGGLVSDQSGNVYVTGITGESSSAESANVPFTLKYDSNGNRLFLLKNDTAGGTSAAIGPDGNIVLSGTAIGEAGSFIHPAMTKITPSGEQVWTTPVDTDGEVAVDVDGSVYLGGTKFSSGFDFFAIKLAADGHEIWRRTTTDGRILGDALLAANRDFFITGDAEGSSADMLTLRYPAGFAPPPPPAGPNAPSGLALAAAKQKLTLQWVDNSNNETGFLIERSVNGASFTQVAQVGANVKTYVDSGLNKNTTYAYRVRAFNGGGNSGYSNTASGQPK